MMDFGRWSFAGAGALVLVACHTDAAPPAGRSGATTPAATVTATPSNPGAAAMQIRSSAFAHQAEIPVKHTCEGGDVSPPLAWSGAPPGTKSFALIVDDPDAPDPAAPKRTWVHWVVYDLPPSATELAEGAGAGKLPEGAKAGLNDWKKPSYGGPCPPIGRHRYFHKIYALDTVLGGTDHTKTDVENAMRGHVLAQGELVGTYQKQKK